MKKHKEIEKNWLTPATRRAITGYIRAAREAQGLTLREAAGAAGVNFTTLHRIEAGTRGIPSVAALDSLSRAVGLDALRLRAVAITEGLTGEQRARLAALIEEV